MDIINTSDIIFASATIHGTIAVTLQLSGLHSVSEIIKAIRNEIGSFSGLLSLSVRNLSQGWARQHSIYIAAAAPGTQLSLF